MSRRPSSTFIVVPLLILVADVLLWGASPGIGLSVWIIAVSAVLIVRFPALTRTTAGMLALCGLTVAVLAGAVDQGALPTWCSIIALMAAAVIGRTGRAPDAVDVLERAASGAVGLAVRPFADARLAMRWRAGHGGPTWRGRGRGWLLPLGFGGLFAGLFFLANPLLGAHLTAGFDWLTHAIAFPAPLRVVLWWMCGLSTWLLLRGQWRARRTSGIATRSDYGHGRIVLVQRSLMVFHALFTLQNGCDLVYLWGGLHLPDGMTYATYAHRGAYPLIATALLAATFILAWFRPGSGVQADPWCRRLVLAWLAQNVALLISALWRLHLYVDVYDLTRWRVAAAAWMVLVGIGLGLIAWRIRRDLRNRWLVNANLTSLVVMLLLLAWIDVDGAIARHNCEHGGSKTDVGYVASLGPAALPALRTLAAAGNVSATDAVRILEIEVDLDLKDWRSWTLAKARWRKHADTGAERRPASSLSAY